MNQVVIQGIGFLALFFYTLSFQHKDRKKLLIWLLIGTVLWTIHYSFLNAWTGALLNAIEGFQALIFYQRDKKKWADSKLWIYIFIFLFVIGGIVTWTNYYDALPIVAMILGTFALWNKETKLIRFFMLAPRPLYFIYNLVVGSYAGMVTEVLILLSILVGMLRLDIFKKKASG